MGKTFRLGGRFFVVVVVVGFGSLVGGRLVVATTGKGFGGLCSLLGMIKGRGGGGGGGGGGRGDGNPLVDDGNLFPLGGGPLVGVPIFLEEVTIGKRVFGVDMKMGNSVLGVDVCAAFFVVVVVVNGAFAWSTTFLAS